jgi:8-oxo-dGTP diphosphatase
MRRLGGAPRRGLAYRDRPGAYGVLLRDGLALLADQEGDLLLPGGGVDPGETPARALHREVYEETGWRIGPARRLGVFARYAWLVEERYHARKIQHVFLARPIRPLGPPLEPDHRPVWMPAAAAVDRLAVEAEAIVLEEALRAGFRG